MPENRVSRCESPGCRENLLKEIGHVDKELGEKITCGDKKLNEKIITKADKLSWQKLTVIAISTLSILCTIVLYSMASECDQNSKLSDVSKKTELNSKDIASNTRYAKENLDMIRADLQRLAQNQLTKEQLIEAFKEVNGK